MSKKCLINIIGAPRKYMEKNANSIKEMLINANSNYNFDIVIHTSHVFEDTFYKKDTNKSRNLKLKEKELETYIYNIYSSLSKNLTVVIEPLDFDIGKHYYTKNLLFYLRQSRINDIINTNSYDIIVNTRNDIGFSKQIQFSKVQNNLYTILGNQGGCKGYANGDFDYCFISNLQCYQSICKCLNKLWVYKDNIYYKTPDLKYVTPIFKQTSVHYDKSYYDEKGKHFDKDLIDKANDMSKSLHISEVFINNFTIYLQLHNSFWDIETFSQIRSYMFK